MNVYGPDAPVHNFVFDVLHALILDDVQVRVFVRRRIVEVEPDLAHRITGLNDEVARFVSEGARVVAR